MSRSHILQIDLVENSPLGVEVVSDTITLQDNCTGMDSQGKDVLLNLLREKGFGVLLWLDANKVRKCNLRSK